MAKRPLLQDSREVIIVDNNTGAQTIDDITGALLVIETIHHEVHEGKTFLSSWKNVDGSDVADNAAWGLYLQTRDKYPHLTFDIHCGGDAEMLLWEGCTFSATGSSWSAFNLNRQASLLPTVQVRNAPTLITGLLLEHILVPGGTGPAQSGGGVGRQGTEWNLNTGTSYYIQGINRAGSAQPASVMAQWYEEEENL